MADASVSKKPTISLEETTYLLTLYTVVHGYKHYGGTCCLHSQLKVGAQARHTLTMSLHLGTRQQY